MNRCPSDIVVELPDGIVRSSWYHCPVREARRSASWAPGAATRLLSRPVFWFGMLKAKKRLWRQGWPTGTVERLIVQSSEDLFNVRSSTAIVVVQGRSVARWKRRLLRGSAIVMASCLYGRKPAR